MLENWNFYLYFRALKFSKAQNNSNTTRFALESHVTVNVCSIDKPMTLLFYSHAGEKWTMLNESMKSWKKFYHSLTPLEIKY